MANPQGPIFVDVEEAIKNSPVQPHKRYNEPTKIPDITRPPAVRPVQVQPRPANQPPPGQGRP
jgi:hypothetical protein